jgi:hypothetical protein
LAITDDVNRLFASACDRPRGNQSSPNETPILGGNANTMHRITSSWDEVYRFVAALKSQSLLFEYETALLLKNLANDAAVHVGQAIVPPLIAKRQPLMVQAEQMQDGRVQIMDVNRVVDDAVAERIG